MKTKSITPLQAMMLRMAGQSIPEEEEEEDEEEYTDSEESDAEDQVSAEAAQSLVNPRLPVAPASRSSHEAAGPALRPAPRPASRRSSVPEASRAPRGSQGPHATHAAAGPPSGTSPRAPSRTPARSASRTPPQRPPAPPAAAGSTRDAPSPSPPSLRTAPHGPPLSLFPPPLNPNVLSAPPSILPRQKPPSSSSGADSAPQSALAPPLRGPALQMPPPPGTTPNPLAPTIEKRATVAGPGGPSAQAGGATISAKPQIINPKTEVTRFVPTALRVRRDRAPGADRTGRREDEREPPKPQAHHSQAPAAGPGMKTKDQMYEAFMREMEGLL
ncbi:hypothetical protein QQF64_026263 [Cirrhinus molitorella]|uniref:WW domain binding protein 11 n=1 Tax=Cirrhinus molitorella TaxID=172907 RepID=A0ABR3NRS4_9TELE